MTSDSSGREADFFFACVFANVYAGQVSRRSGDDQSFLVQKCKILDRIDSKECEITTRGQRERITMYGNYRWIEKMYSRY
jgi:hypothetical protein